MNYRFTLLINFVFIIQLSFSQNKTELPFIEYLLAKEEYDAALKLLSNIKTSNLPIDYVDSLEYLKGWTNYSIKKLELSSYHLKKVSRSSKLYAKSQLFASYNNLHLGKNEEAYNILSSFHPKERKDSIITTFLKSGASLLKRDFDSYNRNKKQLNNSYYAIKKESLELEAIYTDFTTHKKKSATLAGIMSAIIPGSGKIYLGKTGQGISALLLVGGLGMVTAENFVKKGPEKFSTIFFASAFTTFYIGNIYGTIKLSKISTQEYNSYQDAKILFNIHIPLRNLYN